MGAETGDTVHAVDLSGYEEEIMELFADSREKNDRRPWTEFEIAALKYGYEKYGAVEVARRLGRTIDSVYSARKRYLPP